MAIDLEMPGNYHEGNMQLGPVLRQFLAKTTTKPCS